MYVDQSKGKNAYEIFPKQFHKGILYWHDLFPENRGVLEKQEEY